MIAVKIATMRLFGRNKIVRPHDILSYIRTPFGQAS